MKTHKENSAGFVECLFVVGDEEGFGMGLDLEW